MSTTEKALKSFSRDILLADIMLRSRADSKYVRTYDVVIIGGGPAGAYLGYCLSRQGLEPVLFDHSHPREKPCGGVISGATIRRFHLLRGVSLHEEKETRRDFHLLSPSGSKAIVSGKHTLAGSYSRRKLDRYLLDSAVRWGCKHIPEKVTRLRQDNGLWIVGTEKRELRARLVVGAEGVKSLVRKTVLHPHRRDDVALCMGYFGEGYTKSESMFKFIQNRSGIVWLHARDQICSVGISDSIPNAAGLKQDLDLFMQKECSGIRPFTRWSALVPRARSVDAFGVPCSGKNWILVGDAAGHVNPLTGQGIHYALWSAELAAQSIAAGDTRLYDALWREEYGKTLIRATRLQKHFFKNRVLETTLALAHRSERMSEIMVRLLTGDMSVGIAGKQVFMSAPKILFDAIR